MKINSFSPTDMCVIVITDSPKTFITYRDICREDTNNRRYMKAEYVYAICVEDLKGIKPNDNTVLQYVGQYWKSPLFGNRALDKYRAPLGRYRPARKKRGA